jgi:hypothetical protein
MDTNTKKNLRTLLIAFFSIFFLVFNIESVYAVHVGDSYGGGTVFCVSDTADTSKCTTEKGSSGDYGLIMANEDQANYILGPIKKNSRGGITWSSDEHKKIGFSAQSDNDGRTNTAAIIAAFPKDNPKNNAAWLCNNYRDKKESHDDWYLPSKNE